MNTREYLLTCIMEEAAEVIKEASKCLRFGDDDKDPNSPLPHTNREKLAMELCELETLREMLSLPTNYRIMQDKRQRMYTYMNISRSLGTLENEE